jgi:hypothetical protein
MLTDLLSDPRWNGIEGILAILTFVYLLYEKNKQLTVQYRKAAAPIREVLRILVPVFFSWLFLFVLFFGILDLIAFILLGIIFPPLHLGAYFQAALSSAWFYLKNSLPSTFAALSSIDEKVSQKRAVLVGQIVAGIAYVYLLFFRYRPNLVEPLIHLLAPTSNFLNILVLIVVLGIAIFVCSLVLGLVIGSLSTKGVYFGRVFPTRIKAYFQNVKGERLKGLMRVIKDYLPK